MPSFYSQNGTAFLIIGGFRADCMVCPFKSRGVMGRLIGTKQWVNFADIIEIEHHRVGQRRKFEIADRL